MAKSELQVIVNGVDNFSKSFSSSLGKISKDLTKVGTIMTATVTVPLIALGKQFVDSASDLSESANKVDVVFGKAAGTIRDFAGSAAENLGMSEQKALEAAGTFGNLFTAMGLGQDQSADMSEDLLILAADLASFNNMDPTMVLEKLRAGLVGEVEPLRTLGVNLSAAAVETKALEMGLIQEGDAMTAAAKAQASFALIMEQTTNAQGDFARTSDGLANSTRIMKAQFEDAAASMGQLLLPYALKLVNALSTMLTWVQNLSPEWKQFILIVMGVAAALGPLLLIVGQVLGAVSAISTFMAGPLAASIGTAIAAAAPFILALLAIIAVVALVRAAWVNNWGGIQEKTAVVLAFLKQLFTAFVDGVRIIFQAFSQGLQGDWSAMGELLKNAWSAIWDKVKAAALAGIEKFKAIDWGSVGTAIINGIKNAIIAGAKAIAEAIMGVARKALESVKAFLGIESPSTEFAEVGTNIVNGLIRGVVNTDTSAIPASIERSLATMSNSGQQIIANIQAGIQAAWPIFTNMIYTLFVQLQAIIGAAVGPVNNIGEEIAIGIAQTLAANIGAVYSAGAAVGRAAGAGVAAGILSSMGMAVAAARALAAAVSAALQIELKIGSPSRVMADIAQHIPEGIALGIREKIGLPKKELRKLAGELGQVSLSGEIGARAGATKNVNNYYSLTMPTALSQEDVGMAFEIMRALGA